MSRILLQFTYTPPNDYANNRCTHLSDVVSTLSSDDMADIRVIPGKRYVKVKTERYGADEAMMVRGEGKKIVYKNNHLIRKNRNYSYHVIT